MNKTVIEVEENKIVSKAGETVVTVTPEVITAHIGKSEGKTAKIANAGEDLARKVSPLGTAVTTNKSVERAKINISPENIFGEETVAEINKLSFLGTNMVISTGQLSIKK